MKKILIGVLLVLCGQVTNAQRSMEVVDRIEHRVQFLDSQLNLTNEQEIRIRELLTEHQGKMRAMRMDTIAKPEDYRKLKEDIKNSIKAELTPEQQSIMQKHHEFRCDMHNGGQHHNHPYPDIDSKLKVERVLFDSLLSSEEKDIIAQARAKIKAHRDSIRIYCDSSVGNYGEVGGIHRNEIHLMLSPIISKHKTELDAIESRMKPSGRKNRTQSKKVGKVGMNQARDKEHFKYRFLLMNV